MVQLFKFLFCLALVWPNIWPMSASDSCESNLTGRLELFLNDLEPGDADNMNDFARENFKNYLKISEKSQDKRLELLKKYAYEDNYLSFKATGLISQSPSKLTKDSQILGFNSLSNFVAALIFYLQNSKEDLKLDQLLQYFTANQSVFQPRSNILLPSIVQKTVANIKAQPSVDFKLVSRLEKIATSLKADCKLDFESLLYNDFILKVYLNYRYNQDFNNIINDIINDLFIKLYLYQLITGQEVKDNFNTAITRQYFKELTVKNPQLNALAKIINPTAVTDDNNDENSNPEIVSDIPISYNPEDDLVTKLEQKILELVYDQTVQNKLAQIFSLTMNLEELDIARDADSCLYFSKNPDSLIYNQSLIDCRTKQTNQAKRTLFDNFLALWQVDDKNNKYPVDLLHCVIDKAMARLHKIANEPQDVSEDFQNPTTDDPTNQDTLTVFQDFNDYVNFAHSLFLYNLATQLKNWQTSSFSSAKIEDVQKDLLDALNKPQASNYYESEDKPIIFENISQLINLEQLNKIIVVCNDLKTCSLESHYSCTNNCIDYLLQQTSSGQDIFDQDLNLKKEFLDVVKQCSAKDKTDLTPAAKKCLQDNAPVGGKININLINLVEKNLEKLKPSFTQIKKCNAEKCPTSNMKLKMLVLQAYLKAKKSETKKLPKVDDKSVCSDLTGDITDAEIKYYSNLEEFLTLSQLDNAIMMSPMILPVFEKLYSNITNFRQRLAEWKKNLQEIEKTLSNLPEVITSKLNNLKDYLKNDFINDLNEFVESIRNLPEFTKFKLEELKNYFKNDFITDFKENLDTFASIPAYSKYKFDQWRNNKAEIKTKLTKNLPRNPQSSTEPLSNDSFINTTESAVLQPTSIEDIEGAMPASRGISSAESVNIESPELASLRSSELINAEKLPGFTSEALKALDESAGVVKAGRALEVGEALRAGEELLKISKI
jgi:hypothetical protein